MAELYRYSRYNELVLGQNLDPQKLDLGEDQKIKIFLLHITATPEYNYSMPGVLFTGPLDHMEIMHLTESR